MNQFTPRLSRGVTLAVLPWTASVAQAGIKFFGASGGAGAPARAAHTPQLLAMTPSTRPCAPATG